MKHPSSQKTPPLPGAADLDEKTRRGAVTIVVVFLFIVFSTLGLSMLYLSQIYLKSSAYKKNSMYLNYASENGIKQGFNSLVGLLSKAIPPSPLSPEETDELRINARNQGSLLLEKALGLKPPLGSLQSWENLGWESITDFNLGEVLETENYFHVTYRVLIRSEGKIKNFKQRKASSFEAFIGIFAGLLPLPAIPLLVDKKLEQDQKESFMEKNKIAFLPSEKNLLPAQISFSEGGLIPDSALSQLKKALKIRLFYPQNLSNSLLRAALGLEKSNAPVPDGVYLIKDDTGLGGIFVQGDLEEMLLAAEGNYQIVSFLTQKGRWTLSFSPSNFKTIFSTPDDIFYYDLAPKGIIAVNGEVRSLGGGLKDSSGELALAMEEIPSLLSGVRLTIISSDKITLTSHLIQQGVSWTKGIPYIKESNSELNIFSTGKDFLENTRNEGKIVIGKNSPGEIKIQASLTASGNGFSIEGEGKTVHILGSLQAADYFSNGNTLRLKFDERFLKELEERVIDENSPETAKSVFCLSFFKPAEWKE